MNSFSRSSKESRKAGNRCCGFFPAFLLSLFIVFLAPGSATAQNNTTSANEQDPLGPPTERGIRMTPGMARVMGQLFTNEVLVKQHQLDKAKADEAAELVARRVMAAAHAMDENGSALLERLISRVSEANMQAREAEGSGEHRDDNPFSPEFQKEFGERMLPMLPTIRDLIGGIGRDVMPMLPFKEQFKLTGELAGIGTAINGFEQNLQRWSRGEGRPGDDPFSQNSDVMKKDATGESMALKGARETAKRQVDKTEWLRGIWGDYLKDFKKFYELDSSQAATADSLMREYLDRAKVLMQDAAWRDQMYRTQIWLSMARQLRLEPAFWNILSSRRDQSLAPFNELGDQFRLRLEEIPTQAQRQAAEDRINAALKERGYAQAEGK